MFPTMHRIAHIIPQRHIVTNTEGILNEDIDDRSIMGNLW